MMQNTNSASKDEQSYNIGEIKYWGGLILVKVSYFSSISLLLIMRLSVTETGVPV